MLYYQLFMKALFARNSIVSFKGKSVNREDTSGETKMFTIYDSKLRISFASSNGCIISTVKPKDLDKSD